MRFAFAAVMRSGSERPLEMKKKNPSFAVLEYVLFIIGYVYSTVHICKSIKCNKDRWNHDCANNFELLSHPLYIAHLYENIWRSENSRVLGNFRAAFFHL